jgi:glutamate/tyrosine decarboxylase-like PLP-dependent enzyme
MDYAALRARFDAPLPERPDDIEAVVVDLIERARGGLAAMTGPRYFGWLIGGGHPTGMAADWLTSVWGQNAGLQERTPAAAAAEHVAAAWLLELLDLPRESSVGFTTGATMANFAALAAARSEVLRRAGWNCEAKGLFGAPPIAVFAGEDIHASVLVALRYLGVGDEHVIRVAADMQGRMIADALEQALRGLHGPKIIVAQAGHAHSGAFDPFPEIARLAKAHDAWHHIDGAFGLWARAAPSVTNLAKGAELADSWAVDGHKLLQAPYDSGYVIVRDVGALRRAMGKAETYHQKDSVAQNPSDFTPELSRRARGFSTWAMIRALGRQGIAEMVERHCLLARRFEERLVKVRGIAVLNEVTLNQVAVRFGVELDSGVADELTRQVIDRVQHDGVCFVSGAVWRGAEILRISVISHATTEADVDLSIESILSAWDFVREQHG